MLLFGNNILHRDPRDTKLLHFICSILHCTYYKVS